MRWLIASLALICSLAQAAGVDELMSWAAMRAGMTKAERGPVIESIPQTEICKLWTGEASDCRALGLFIPPNKVYLAAEVESASILGQSVLIHELTHYMQFLLLGQPVSCPEIARREAQAYAVQASYFEAFGLYSMAQVVRVQGRQIRCSTKG